MLSALKNIISFTDVASGAHFTWLSVPQMITRATPNDMGVQYKEKSVLSAFDNAGFETMWFSNQDPDYYTGSFTLHAKTADICLFPDAKQLSHSDLYDDRYLSIIDSVIRNNKRNLFIVFHTMGSHWDYSKRYPDSFDYFRPSGKTVSINPPKRSEKRTIINSYDNSVRYSDFIIDSVIQIVKKFSLVSYVTYVSDHGEDLFNLNKDQLNFHLTASRNTLHVPLFIWTSDRYNRIYPSKISALLSHQDSKIGENDIFYTLLNLANITFPGFDSTKSISSNAFKDSRQEYIEQGDNHPKYYSKLPQ
jgi:glucan phosphoethanolaminetransferase (alkaline phosphatase superfamily)